MAAEGDLSLRLHVITWNMNSRLPSEGIPESLLMLSKDPENLERCVYAIGVQEGSQVGVWSDFILGELGDPFMLVGQANIGGIHLAIFVTEDVVKDYDFDISSDMVSCGLGNIYWNKGAVGFLVKIGDAKLLFVNSHLAAQQDRVKERNQDYHRISTELFKDKAAKGAEHTIEGLADAVFWCGDFNYRIEGNRRSVDYALSKGMMDVLLSNDQLAREMQAGRCFSDYTEGGINFLPTYKFDNGTDNYDSSSKRRVPSWTDRILWKVCESGKGHASVQLWLYDAVTEMTSSDHKPVTAVFDVHYSQKVQHKSLDALLNERMKRSTLQAQPNVVAITTSEALVAEVKAVSKVLDEVQREQKAGSIQIPVPTSEPEQQESAAKVVEALAQAAEAEEKEREMEAALAREALKEPIAVAAAAPSASFADLRGAVDGLFDSFEGKVFAALDLHETLHLRKAKSITDNVVRLRRHYAASREDLRHATEAMAAAEAAARAEEKEESPSPAPREDKGCQAEEDPDEAASQLYQKVSELRTELYQERRTHIQTKAKLEILNKRLAKKDGEDEGKVGSARRKSSVSSIATAKMMQNRMRKKQSAIYG